MATKFKVGDRVRNMRHYNDTHWPKGHEFIIDEIRPNGYGEVLIQGETAVAGTFGGIFDRDCELVEETKEKTVSNVNYHVLKESIVVNFNGKTEVVSKSDGRYADILDCIREGRLEDIPACVDIAHGFKDSGIELRDGILYEGSNAIPTELNDRILAYKDARLPYDSLLKFWEKLKQNPSFNSRKMLFKFLENNGHCITEEGNFIAYRGINENFTDRHTGKWDNSPGRVCEMDRSEVDDNPNNTCSTGLHVACFAYAKDFGPKLVEVEVSPTDVITVPTDYQGTKMRVCRFKVLQECSNIRTELLYGHTDTSESDELEGEDDWCEGCMEDSCGEDKTCEDHCQKCGAETAPFAKYCIECGEEL